MGDVGSVACVGFLVDGSGACALLGGAGSFPSGGQGHISGVFLGVCELIMTEGSLLANGWGCVPLLVVVWPGASSTGACWPFGGAWSSC